MKSMAILVVIIQKFKKIFEILYIFLRFCIVRYENRNFRYESENFRNKNGNFRYESGFFRYKSETGVMFLYVTSLTIQFFEIRILF